MATMTAQKTKQKEEVATTGKVPTPSSDYPFYLSRLRDEFDRLIGRFARAWPTLWQGTCGWHWGLDVRDEDDAIVVRAEAPGIEAGNFDVRVTDDRLILRAIRKAEGKVGEGKAHEYREQECHQSLALPAGIDKERVDARYHNGVLTVTFPKTEEGKGKRVTVRSV